jgi:predicted metal-binding membrane protein
LRGKPAPARQAAAIPLTIGFAVAAWAAILVLHATGRGRMASHESVFESGNPLGGLTAFIAAWLLMIAAMMLPTVLPALRSLDTGAARFLLAYAAGWLGFGLVALAGDAAVHRTVDSWAWLGAHPQLVAAGALLLAGIYQLSPFKLRCLDEVHRVRTTRRYTTSCLGCCGGLMFVMFAIGVGSLAWMVLLTLAMITEKALPGGRRLARPLGVALVAVVPLAVLSSGTIA